MRQGLLLALCSHAYALTAPQFYDSATKAPAGRSVKVWEAIQHE